MAAWIRKIAVGIVLVFMIVVPAVAAGQDPAKNPENQDQITENDELENVLEGFEEKTPAENGIDQVLEGFEETGETETVQREFVRETMSYPRTGIDGFFKIGASWNFTRDAPESGETDWRSLSRLENELQLEFSAKFSPQWEAFASAKGVYDAVYVLKGADEYTNEVISENETEFELRESYVLGTLMENLDLRFGRQILVWGKSDNIRITDVLNPMDMREPGITDIEDLRLPVTMTRADYYFGDWNLSAIGIHEIRFNKTPVFGSEFYPGDRPPPDETEPSSTVDNTEWALSLSGIFSGYDLDFYYAYIFDDQPHAETATHGLPPHVHLVHSRLHMAGFSYNRALGNWLLKTEGAIFEGFEFFNRPDETYTRLDVLAGIEYSGMKNAAISLELANRHLFDFDEALEQGPDYANEDEFQTVIRYTKDFRNETLTLTALASLFGTLGDDGAFERITLEYDVTDTVQLKIGAVLYQSGDMYRFNNIGDNDRLILEAEYHF